MPLTLVVEDGTAKATANTFISRADAVTALSYRPHAEAWADLAQTTQEQILVWACKLLQQEVPARGWRWRGAVVDTDQALPFPRDAIYSVEGVLLDNDAVPQAVKDAQCEIALLLASIDLEQRADERMKTSIDPKSGAVTFGRDLYPVIPDRIFAPLLPWAIDTGRRVVRG